MEDVYPIGINSTFSKWNTVCNTTLGDCGCDNCQGNVQDVPSRLDDLSQYEKWLGLWPKTKAHNPQSFHGENYWMRDPTVAEEVVMNILAFNHGAKAIFSWVYPAPLDLAQIHGVLAKVVTRAPVVDFIVGAKPTMVRVAGLEILDAAFWVIGKKMLVSVVNGGYDDIDEPISLSFPDSVQPKGASLSVWGSIPWQVLAGKLTVGGLSAMTASMIILDL